MAAVVGFEDDGARGVAVVGTDAPQRPVLCIRPMTHGDARFAEGRRAGLLEAAAMFEKVADELPKGSGHWASRAMERAYEAGADMLRTMAGEP